MRPADPAPPPHPSSPRGRRRRTAALALGLTLWLGAAVGGGVLLLRYDAGPGAAAAASATWPADVPVPADPARHTLVVALHPKCPCSRATVREVSSIAAACGDRLRVVALLVLPPGAPDDWGGTPLADAARAIPGAVVRLVPAGGAARGFGALTSGHAALYSPAGRLMFTGGMTASRGHGGGGAGARAVLAAVLDGGAPAIAAAPVFGCPLSNDSQAPSAGRP